MPGYHHHINERERERRRTRMGMGARKGPKRRKFVSSFVPVCLFFFVNKFFYTGFFLFLYTPSFRGGILFYLLSVLYVINYINKLLLLISSIFFWLEIYLIYS